MRTTTTTGKEDDNSKDNNSKDDGEDGEDDNNHGSNGDSSGASISAGSSQGNVRLFAILCRALVFLVLTYHGNHTDMFWNTIFWSKLVQNSIRHVQTCPLDFILFVPILGLFYVYSGLNPGLNCVDQFWQSPNGIS